MITPWYVYILECHDRSFYVGITDDLAKRLERHNAGKAATWTKHRRPVKMVFAEEHPTKSSARRRELEIKGWRREKKIALINSSGNLLREPMKG